MPTFHTILGAGGVIANSLALELIGHQLPVRLVSRNPSPIPGSPLAATFHQASAPHTTAATVPVITTYTADLTDPGQTLEAIRDSAVVYCCIGMPYNYTIWRQQWPRIVDNLIAACQKTHAKLLFFDNVYMYGETKGPMTEETPYDPCSRKGDLRARLATQLMSEVRKGNIIAAIARAADFYGPGADKTALPNILVFQPLANRQRAKWLVNARVRHSFTYIPDAIKALCLIARDEEAWNQVWHLPTAANPLTGAQFIEKAAAEWQQSNQYRVLPKWAIRLGGIFDRATAELYEMLYQYEYEYLFDSTKFETAWSFQPTSYEEGIRATAASYRSREDSHPKQPPPAHN